MIKAIAVVVWLMLWACPFMVAVCADSCVLVIIAIVWGVIMKGYTKAYAPEWMQASLSKVFGTHEW